MKRIFFLLIISFVCYVAMKFNDSSLLASLSEQEVDVVQSAFDDVPETNNSTESANEFTYSEDDVVANFLQTLDDTAQAHEDIDFTPLDAISYAIAVYGTTGIEYVYEEEAIEYVDGIAYYIGIKENDEITTVLFVTNHGEINVLPY